ncbi:MAG TPA: DUF929 family protein [Actinocrinis sp.]|jgi:hypothetical protein
MSRSNATRAAAARRRAAARQPSEAQRIAVQRKIEAQRAVERRERNRRNAIIAVVSAIVVIAALVGIKLAVGSSAAAPQTAGATVTATVVKQATGVPAATLAAVGAGTANALPVVVKNTAVLKSGTKPEVLYMGYEWCPFCAAERWAAVVALSRFGTFTGLSLTTSASNDTDPNTHTFTFANAKYTSQYIAFVTVEMQNGQRQTLQSPTSAEQSLLSKYDAPPYSSSTGGLPFYDFGNQYVEVDGSTYDPGVLAGQDWSQIASQLGTASSKDAKAIDGSANVMTGIICKLTGNQPSAVCTAPSITALAGKL